MNLEEIAKVLDVLKEQLTDLIGSQDKKLDRLLGESKEVCEGEEPQREYYGVLGGIECQLEIIFKQVSRLDMLNSKLEQALFQQEEEVYAINNVKMQSTGTTYH
jgi:hypothetical protein